LEGLQPHEIHASLQDSLGPHTPSNKTILNWVNEFKRGRQSVQNEDHNRQA